MEKKRRFSSVISYMLVGMLLFSNFGGAGYKALAQENEDFYSDNEALEIMGEEMYVDVSDENTKKVPVDIENKNMEELPVYMSDKNMEELPVDISEENGKAHEGDQSETQKEQITGNWVVTTPEILPEENQEDVWKIEEDEQEQAERGQEVDWETEGEINQPEAVPEYAPEENVDDSTNQEREDQNQENPDEKEKEENPQENMIMDAEIEKGDSDFEEDKETSKEEKIKITEIPQMKEKTQKNIAYSSGKQSASAGRFHITVVYDESAEIPENAELRVKEYASDSEEFKKYQEMTEKTFSWLLDIGFYIDPQKLEQEKDGTESSYEPENILEQKKNEAYAEPPIGLYENEMGNPEEIEEDFTGQSLKEIEEDFTDLSLKEIEENLADHNIEEMPEALFGQIEENSLDELSELIPDAASDYIGEEFQTEAPEQVLATAAYVTDSDMTEEASTIDGHIFEETDTTDNHMSNEPNMIDGNISDETEASENSMAPEINLTEESEILESPSTESALNEPENKPEDTQEALDPTWIEIEPAAPVQVSIEIEDMLEDDKVDLIHFSENGVEIFPSEEIQSEITDTGCAEICIELESFSFVAGETYRYATVVRPEEIVPGQVYVIYLGDSNNLYFMNHDKGTISAVTKSAASLKAEGKYTRPGDVLTWTESILGNGVLWEAVREPQSGEIVLKTLNPGSNQDEYLYINGSTLTTRNSREWQSRAIFQTHYNSSNQQTNYIDVYFPGGIGTSNDRYLSISKQSSTTARVSLSRSAVGLTVAQVGTLQTLEAGTNFPQPVYTGRISLSNIYFYNIIVGKEETVTGLPGIRYKISGNGKDYYLTTTESIKISIEDLHLPTGDYTMIQEEVPEGYLLNPEKWTFSIFPGQTVLQLTESSTNTLTGIVFNAAKNEDLQYQKTAEVYDYKNREYRVDLTAKSFLKRYSMKNVNINFLLDQSNSMLFPAGLEETGVEIEVKSDLSVDTSPLDALKGSGTQNELYYLIASPETSSTVIAVWNDGNGHWLYQDASYYAKAYWLKNDPSGEHVKVITDPNVPNIFPGITNYNSTAAGGCLTLKLGGALTTPGKYKVYVSSPGEGKEYNRLHYLMQSTIGLVQALAAINPEVRVTIDRFAKRPYQDCISEQLLNQEKVDRIVNDIQQITTTDGTRQDLALDHVLTNSTENGTHLSNDKEENYVILITDGAPVASPGEGTTGSFNPNPVTRVTNSTTIYDKVKYEASLIRDRATLITVGLSMKNVESGSQLLKYIATNGSGDYASSEASGEWWFQPENSAHLTQILENKVFYKLLYAEPEAAYGTVCDFIADSFYPIDLNTKLPMEAGAWITLDGNVVPENDPNAAGHVLHVEGTENWKVEWKESSISGIGANSELDENSWHGTVYLKAREDFIGGNAIATNRDATLTYWTRENEQPLKTTVHYEKPNVNVRLLDLNQNSTEVTVFLGDNVSAYEPDQSDRAPVDTGKSPVDALKDLYEKIVFTKIVDSSGKTTVGEATDYSGENCKNQQTGWATNSTLTMKLKELTKSSGMNASVSLDADELEALLKAANGTGTETEKQQYQIQVDSKDQTPYIAKEYTYSELDGAVGFFTYKVIKSSVEGEPADLNDHQSQVTGTQVETYTLQVTYVPYALGSEKRTNEITLDGRNHYNKDQIGTDDPGKEINADENPMTLKSKNQHIIHVIDGCIELEKILNRKTELGDGESVTFTFDVKRTAPADAGGNPILYDFEKNRDGERNPDSAKDYMTISIELTKEDLEADMETDTEYFYKKIAEATSLKGLPRGTYTVTEQSMAGYKLEKVEDDGSQCKYGISEEKQSIDFFIGTYTDGTPPADINAVTKENLLYERSEDGTTINVRGKDDQKGIYGKAVFTNVERSSYDLPSVGGNGIFLYFIWGVALMILGTLIFRKNVAV